MSDKKSGARTAFRRILRLRLPPKPDGASVTPPGKISDADAVVWLSGALVNSSRMGPFAPVPHDFRKAQPAETPDHIRQAARASSSGQDVPEDWLPRRCWLPASVGLKGPLPLVLGKGWLVMHRSVADIFRSFDPGECRIVPVELVDGDHATVLSDEYDLFHVRNRRPTLDLERSTSLVVPDPRAAPIFACSITKPAISRDRTLPIRPLHGDRLSGWILACIARCSCPRRWSKP